MTWEQGREADSGEDAVHGGDMTGFPGSSVPANAEAVGRESRGPTASRQKADAFAESHRYDDRQSISHGRKG